jgi:hypothetical protein
MFACFDAYSNLTLVASEEVRRLAEGLLDHCRETAVAALAMQDIPARPDQYSAKVFVAAMQKDLGLAKDATPAPSP